MILLRQYIAFFLAIALFMIALLAVSIRIFIPQDMAAPAPIEQVNPTANQTINQTIN